MANSRGPSTTRNMMNNGRHSLLPPKCPFPTIAPSYGDYISTSVIGAKGIPKYRDGNSQHHRASSESLLAEEQPSWLDELLNEPESPVQRGHRRSSSDSFTYLEAANAATTEYAVKDEQRMRNMNSAPSWASQDFLYKQQNFMNKSKVPQNAHSSGTTSSFDNVGLRRTVSLGATQELNGIASTLSEKQDAPESGSQESVETHAQDANIFSERKMSSNTRDSSSELDIKHAKQQFAQRSRVRKIQYIAELERNVQALQVEGSEVSAELEFLNQQSLILGMENKALKQRLENLAQEQLIKCLEHEVLEREIGRLRALYQQQQQQPQLQSNQPSQRHRRTASRDRLDFQFGNLSLNNKNTSSVRDPVSTQPRT